jgi:hypothetical protein
MKYSTKTYINNDPYEFSDSEQIVSLINCNGTVYVATSKRVFKLDEDKLIPIKIKILKGSGNNRKGKSPSE